MVSESVSTAVAPARVGVVDIFRTFLFIGATSFCGGVVAYLRENLVGGRQWLDDQEFVRVMEISQTLPGLNATNMSVIIGDRLGDALVGELQPRQAVDDGVAAGGADGHKVGVELHLPRQGGVEEVDAVVAARQAEAEQPEQAVKCPADRPQPPALAPD